MTVCTCRRLLGQPTGRLTGDDGDDDADYADDADGGGKLTVVARADGRHLKVFDMPMDGRLLVTRARVFVLCCARRRRVARDYDRDDG